MKHLRYHWTARPISYFASMLMVLPILVLWMTAVTSTSARADELADSGLTPWAVIDFDNHSGYGGAEVGREASDALVVELGKSNRYTVAPRDEIQQGMDSLGQSYPLDKIGLQKLGRQIGATGMVTGEVASVTFSNKPRRATATVVIRVVDVSTGELINGALVQGTSTPRAIGSNDDDALVNQAIDNASFLAVRQIEAFTLPKATILANTDQVDILLNKGSKDGLYEGLNMIVLRQGSEVGRIRVSDVSSDQSDAIVTQRELGVREGDVAVAIYDLPSYSILSNGDVRTATGKIDEDTIPGPKAQKPAMFSGIAGLLVALFVGAVLLSVARKGITGGAVGGGSIGNPVAILERVIEPADGVPVGANGTPPAGLTDLADYVPVAVHITATNGNVPIQSLVEYHVFRNDFSVFAPTVGIVALAGTSPNIANIAVPILTIAPQAGNLSTFDDGSLKTIDFSVPGPPTATTAGGTAGTAGTTGATLVTFTTTPAGGVFPGTGIPDSLVGTRFQYFIQGLWLSQGTGTTTTTTTGGGTAGTAGTGGTAGGTSVAPAYFLTSRNGTNFLTYIEPVILLPTIDTEGGAGPVFKGFSAAGPTVVNCNVPATRGANDYILQISLDPAFKTNVKTFRPLNTPQPFSATQQAPQLGANVQMLVNENLDSDFGLPSNTSAVLFARIGVRDSSNGTSNNPYVFDDEITISGAPFLN